MGTTTKMAIPYPEATGLVKDGWEDMKDIATQVDAKSGLVLLNTTAFSAVSSQSINNVFTSSFTNYSLIVTLTPSAFGTVKLRLRASGTDATGSNYFFQQLRAYSTTVATSNLTETGWQFGASFNDDATADYKAIICDIFRPNEAVNTKYLFRHFQGSDRSELNHVGGVHTVASAYDGFTIYPSTGTITGTVSVYGYNK